MIKKYNTIDEIVGRLTKNENGKDQGKHKSILHEYGFNRVDEFDELLLQGIDRGYFDQKRIVEQAEVLQNRFLLGDQNNEFYMTWRDIHDLFNNDDKVAIERLIASAKTNLAVISQSNLDGTVTF